MARKMQAGAMETAYQAVTHTPVDTGEARASWEAGLNARPRGQRKPFQAYPSLHNARATLLAGRFGETANAQAALLAIADIVMRAGIKDTIRIVNAVQGEDGEHYLDDLNFGRSLQVGPFWLQEAGKIGRDAARKERVFRAN